MMFIFTVESNLSFDEQKKAALSIAQDVKAYLDLHLNKHGVVIMRDLTKLQVEVIRDTLTPLGYKVSYTLPYKGGIGDYYHKGILDVLR